MVGDFKPENLPLSIQRQLSMGLTTLSENGLPLPGLATSWEATEGGKSFKFNLRKDVAWH